MNLTTSELMIIERALQDRINADHDPAIAFILQKIRIELSRRRNREVDLC